MKLATTAMIPEIDRYCTEQLHISARDLIDRSGKAVARVVRDRTPSGGRVAILAGRGNNGADGYAAALHLLPDYRVAVYDVLDAGQDSEEGRYYLEAYKAAGGEVCTLNMSEEQIRLIHDSDCIVDAMFGTGFHGEIPESIRRLADAVRGATHAQKIAVDVPLGVNADDGSILSDSAMYVGTTVELSFVKCGIVSYPARGYAGDIVYDDLGLPQDRIAEAFPFKYHLIEKQWVIQNLPERPADSHKGTFGKLLLLAGCDTYRGAAALAMEGALRGGVGMVCYRGSEALCTELRAKFPEGIYQPETHFPPVGEAQMDAIAQQSAQCSATLIGCGSGNTPELLCLVRRLLETPGDALVLDADAINCLCMDGAAGPELLKSARRPVILTPHPMEFSRLCGVPVTKVQQHRIEYAKRFAAEYRILLVLKGAGTVVTDGDELYINHTGSCALAKAGSGDVLAGFIASLIAQGIGALTAAALGVYFHGKAADSLAREFSSFGVTPSDLPKQIAREMASFQTQEEKI